LKKIKKPSFLRNIDVRLVFCLKFFIIFFGFSFILEQINLSFFTNYLTFLISTIMSLPYNSNVIFAGKNFIITNICTGLTTVSILAATIFSMRKPQLKNKVVLFLFGSIIILLVNIPRIILVIYSHLYGFDSELVHVLTWFVMSGVVLFIVIIGLRNYYKKELVDML